MSKDEMSIMVVSRHTLLGNRHFEGFKKHEEFDFERVILESHYHMRRGDAEVDPSHKQPITYCLIVNPELKKVFAYQRSTNIAHAHESRLHGKWSLGVGGHVEEMDGNVKNPLYDCLLRELDEEVEINGSIYPRALGYVNDESEPVGQVHFGLLYIVETDATEVHPKDPEVAQGKLMSLEEIKEIMDSPSCTVEGWSKIAYGALLDLWATSYS